MDTSAQSNSIFTSGTTVVLQRETTAESRELRSRKMEKISWGRILVIVQVELVLVKEEVMFIPVTRGK